MRRAAKPETGVVATRGRTQSLARRVGGKKLPIAATPRSARPC